MIIRNKTRNTVLSSDAEECSTFFSKFIGLMFSRCRSLVFVFRHEQIIPLHMIFVFYPIDVIFLSKKKMVVELKQSFLPFTFYSPSNKAMYVIELPAGAIGRSKTRISDQIII